MKIGRNDSCPCGSGKKYKLCCGAAPEVESPQVLAWRRVSRAVQDHGLKLLTYIAETHGSDALPEAWEEFTLWSGEPFSAESPQVTLFFPWLFYVWRPLTTETAVEARCLHSIPPAQAYLIARGKGMDRLLYRYLSACLDSPFGFFEVVSTEPGHGMQLREILTETDYSVLERSASATLEPGDIVYGMVVECDGVAMLEAIAPVAIPIGLKPMIVEERELLLADEAREREADDIPPPGDAAAATPLSKITLALYDFSNRELYWDLVLPLLNPTMPALHNTDGDKLSMQRLIFAIDSPADAFAALKGLAVGHTEEEMLKEAAYGASGMLQRITFNWIKRGNSRHKGLETTLLGRIEIDGAQMAVEVNSAERAAEFKRLVNEQMGEKARYRVTEIQSMERLVNEARANPSRAPDLTDVNQEALRAQPEVQAQLRALMIRHYDAWVDDKIPALQGKTPREAVATSAGREKVDALIRDIERTGPQMPGYDASITAELRKTLGI